MTIFDYMLMARMWEHANPRIYYLSTKLSKFPLLPNRSACFNISFTTTSSFTLADILGTERRRHLMCLYYFAVARLELRGGRTHSRAVWGSRLHSLDGATWFSSSHKPIDIGGWLHYKLLRLDKQDQFLLLVVLYMRVGSMTPMLRGCKHSKNIGAV